MKLILFLIVSKPNKEMIRRWYRVQVKFCTVVLELVFSVHCFLYKTFSRACWVFLFWCIAISRCCHIPNIISWENQNQNFCRIFVAEGKTELTAQARLLGVYLKFWRPLYRSSTSSILIDINHTLASLERTLTLRSMWPPNRVWSEESSKWDGASMHV